MFAFVCFLLAVLGGSARQLHVHSPGSCADGVVQSAEQLLRVLEQSNNATVCMPEGGVGFLSFRNVENLSVGFNQTLSLDCNGGTVLFYSAVSSSSIYLDQNAQFNMRNCNISIWKDAAAALAVTAITDPSQTLFGGLALPGARLEMRDSVMHQTCALLENAPTMVAFINSAGNGNATLGPDAASSNNSAWARNIVRLNAKPGPFATLNLDYINVTAWCGPNWDAAAPFVHQASQALPLDPAPAANPSPAPEASAIDEPVEAQRSSDDDGGTPLWAWLGPLLGALVLLSVVGFLVAYHRRSQAPPHAHKGSQDASVSWRPAEDAAFAGLAPELQVLQSPSSSAADTPLPVIAVRNDQMPSQMTKHSGDPVHSESTSLSPELQQSGATPPGSSTARDATATASASTPMTAGATSSGRGDPERPSTSGRTEREAGAPGGKPSVRRGRSLEGGLGETGSSSGRSSMTHSGRGSVRKLRNTVSKAVEQLKGDLGEKQLKIFGVLGRGGFGTVYHGEWRGLEVAIKTVIFQSEDSEKDTALVASEAAIASNLSHPHVVATYSHDICDIAHDEHELSLYKFYLFQEYCNGGSLRALIHEGLFAPETAMGCRWKMIMRTLQHISDGMTYVHSRRICHGDLTPSNVLLKFDAGAHDSVSDALQHNSFNVKVADFGLALRMSEGVSHASNVHRGTPFFIAPETVKNQRLHSGSDVYAFGVIMWELLRGTSVCMPRPAEEEERGPEGAGARKKKKQRGVVRHPDYPELPPGTPLTYTLTMKACLSIMPQERPTFIQLRVLLQDVEKEVETGRYINSLGHAQGACDGDISLEVDSSAADSSDVRDDQYELVNKWYQQTGTSSMPSVRSQMSSEVAGLLSRHILTSIPENADLQIQGDSSELPA